MHQSVIKDIFIIQGRAAITIFGLLSAQYVYLPILYTEKHI